MLLLWATAPVLGSQARKPGQKGKLPLVGPSQLLQNELRCARITHWAAPTVREHRPTLGPTAWELHTYVLSVSCTHCSGNCTWITSYEINHCHSPPNRIASLLTQAMSTKIPFLTGSENSDSKSSQDKAQSQSTRHMSSYWSYWIQTSNVWSPPPIT